MMFCVGPLPSPIHGFALINQAMLQQLKATGPVQVVDLAPIQYKRKRGVTRLAHTWELLRFFCLTPIHPHGCLYIGLSGGIRQLIDMMFIVWAQLCFYRIVIHHHSFAYLNRPTAYQRWVLRLTRHATHVALGPAMARLLTQVHGIAPDRIHVLSNVAFVEAAVAPLLQDDESSVIQAGQGWGAHQHTLTVGFLSNITREKGIFDFFEVMATLRSRNIPVQGLIAGPVDASIQTEFEEALASHANVAYLGPVYGHQKKVFFSRLNVFVFPTDYINEAEPVTLWEAMSAGALIVAKPRGCIADMVTPEIGQVFEKDRFVSAAAAYIEQLVRANKLIDKPVMINTRDTVQAYFNHQRHDAQTSLQALIEQMRVYQ